MSDTLHSLTTSGLSPKKQIECWSEALTDLCGQFEIDPLKASSLEANVTYTTVSKLKLCQIDVSQHRIAHTIARARSSEHPYVKIHFQTEGTSYFEQDGRRLELKPGDIVAYDVATPAFDHQSGANTARCRHRSQGIAAGARLPSGT